MATRHLPLPPALAFAVILAGCTMSASPPTAPSGSAVPSGSPPSSAAAATQAASTIAPASPTPSPTASARPWPSLDPATVLIDRITCSEDAESPTFTVAAFNAAPPGGESGTDAAAEGLRKALGGDGVPAHGWRRVVDSPDAVLFVAPAEDGGWRQVLLWPGTALGSSAAWAARTVGECRLRPVAPADASFADLWLDPARLPATSARSVRLLLVETACASGAFPAGRIRTPTVLDGPGRVVVLISITRRPGNQDCQGNPRYEFDLSLPTELGSRPLQNGAILPPGTIRPWGTTP